MAISRWLLSSFDRLSFSDLRRLERLDAFLFDDDDDETEPKRGPILTAEGTFSLLL